ncbi:hypothetical protein A6R68_15909 [Neotoma lepida]|uniref:GAB2 n=1 Tax=Neotoma lepida TaxID=56216 RepID=A0A1A6H4N4_NEOLE|nr:hypothetical protein A6R68_15909 [Neotoma lepida]
MSGNPDVLKYYKNEHSNKPLQIINLNFCEQVDIGLTFKKKLQDSFVFDIKTTYQIPRTFTLDKNHNAMTVATPGDSATAPRLTPQAKGTNSPAPKKSTVIVDYLALDFQPGSLSPHCKPSTSSVTSDEKVGYVQVDKEKTQGLQNIMQEWTDVQQSSETSKDTEL